MEAYIIKLPTNNYILESISHQAKDAKRKYLYSHAGLGEPWEDYYRYGYRCVKVKISEEGLEHENNYRKEENDR